MTNTTLDSSQHPAQPSSAANQCYSTSIERFPTRILDRLDVRSTSQSCCLVNEILVMLHSISRLTLSWLTLQYFPYVTVARRIIIIVFFPLQTECDVSDIMTPTGRMKGKLRQELPQPKQETQDGAGNRKRLFPFRADSYPALLIGFSPFPTFKAGSCLIESVLE